jgi:plastocyanin
MRTISIRTSLRLAAGLTLLAAFLFAALFGPKPWLEAGNGTKIVVEVGDDWFCSEEYNDGTPCVTTIQPGFTVSWDFSNAVQPHTSTECGSSCNTFPPPDPPSPLWQSPVIAGGTTEPYERVFDEPGTYNYYCEVHWNMQKGVIVVEAPGTPPATPPTATPTRTPTSQPAGTGDVNCSGGDADSIDAALVLQLTAGLVDELSCEENADTDQNGQTNAIDAALILQFNAGLIDELPV